MEFLFTVRPTASKSFSASLPVMSEADQVNEAQVVVRAAGDEAQAAVVMSASAKACGVLHHLVLIGRESAAQRLAEGTRPCRR